MTTATCELTDKVVFDYWEEKAANEGMDPAVTIRDHYFHNLEIDRIRRFLRPTDTVLDIGCGNGYATTKYAGCVERVVGVDYAPQMIEAAKKRLIGEPESIRSKTAFQVGDARKLPFEDETFSCAVMQRCLINIPDRDQQVQAVIEAGRTLQRGGLLVLGEVTLQGHERINKYRKMFGLEKLKVHWHNTYVDELLLLEAVSRIFELVETIRFGMYGFLSKVVHPLFVAPDEPSFDAPMNALAARIAREIPDFDGCSHQVLFVFRKR